MNYDQGHSENANEYIFRQIFKNLPENIVVTNSDGTVLYTNKSSEHLTLNYFDELAPDDDFLAFANKNIAYPQIADSIREVFTGERGNFTATFCTQNGDPGDWFEINAKRINEQENSLFLIIIKNITPEKMTENALRDSEQNYRTLTETTSDVIMKIDEENRIIFINQAAEDVFGYSAFELIGKPLSLLISENPRLFQRMKQEMELCSETASKKTNLGVIEVSALHRNGNIFPLEISFGEYLQNKKPYFFAHARDISKRKTAETGNALLASIVESSEDAVISKNLNGIVTSWNKGAENIFGYTTEEMVGQSITMLIPPNMRDEETLILKKIRNGERIQHFETIRQHKNGSLLNISLTVSPVRNEKGEIIGASKIARDITQTQKITRDFRESQLMLSLAMQSSRMGAWEHDISTDTVRWSKELEEIFGLEEGTFGSSRAHFYKLVHEDDRERVWAEVQTAIFEKLDYTVEFRFYHADGGIRWMEGRGKAVYSEKGEPVRVYGIGIDITQRRLAEESLRESEERYRTIFNSIDEGFCIIELIFDENNKPLDFRFIETNPMFEKMIGLRNADGKTALELIPNLESHWFEIYGKIALTGEPMRFTDSSEVMKKWFDVYATRVGDAQSRRVALIFNDITERKLIELEREEILRRETLARKQAEDANRAKDEFLSILSHELRTPLNAILGWTRILTSSSLDEEKKHHAVQTIERNARLQKNLIEDLLDVSRIISGKMRIEKEEIDLVSIINSALEMVRPLAESKNVRLAFLSKFENLKFFGDATRLHQIVVNLANNAVKFTDEEGDIGIYLNVENDVVRLEVCDTGIGIAPEFLLYIFDRFRQADSTIIRNQGGLGLGLTIVRHLVELHGGTIRAASEGIGRGSIFTVELPLCNFETIQNQTEHISKNENESAAHDFKLFLTGKKILMVDDDLDGVEPLKILLEKHGAKIVYAESVRAALGELGKERFDLLISDIGMPEMDGFKLIEQIRQAEHFDFFPAIALTAYAGIEDRQKALSAGFQFHLSKPVDFDVLLKTMSAIFKNESEI